MTTAGRESSRPAVHNLYSVLDLEGSGPHDGKQCEYCIEIAKAPKK